MTSPLRAAGGARLRNISRCVSTPHATRRSRLCRAAGAVGAGALALVVFIAASASAASIVYVGADGNVFLTSPDGSVKHQVTRDGIAADKYRSPSQTDDGRVVTIRKTGSSSGAVLFLDRRSGQVLDTWTLPREGTGSFAPLTGGEISSGGALFLYDWNYFDCPLSGCESERRVSLVSGPGQTNPCAPWCARGYIRPRWIAGTPYAGFLDESFSGVWIQTENGPEQWLDFTGLLTLGFDIEDGKALVVVKAEGSPQTLAVLQSGGTPPGGDPQILCTLEGFASDSPRWSPDASMIAWDAADGIYVSPAPPESGGGTCTLQPRLIAAGGTKPEWGPIDAPTVAPPPAPPPAPVDMTAPRLTRLSLSPRWFRAAVKGPSIVARGGSTVSYSLTEPADVSFAVQRSTRGWRVGGRCVSTRRPNRPAKRCLRYQTLRGGMLHRGASGANKFRFSGRLRNRRLAPGRYRLRAVATDATRNRSQLRHVGFRILRGRFHRRVE